MLPRVFEFYAEDVLLSDVSTWMIFLGRPRDLDGDLDPNDCCLFKVYDSYFSFPVWDCLLYSLKP
jgi:hypothetical protein